MRLIDKDAILHDLENGVYPASMTYTLAVDIAKGLIEVASEIDAVPVVRGKWIPIPEHENKRCSVCNIVFSDFTLGYFCPSCGAKMEDKP